MSIPLYLDLPHLAFDSSGKHIEEIRQEGLEMPVANQIEVCTAPWLVQLAHARFSHGIPVPFAASPVLPTEGDRGLRQETRHRGSGVFTPRQRCHGRPRDHTGGQ
jgi:hypothetical protein